MTRRWTSFALILALAIGGFSQPAAAVDYVKIPQDPTGGGFQAWPDVARLNDGRLFCTFYNGYRHGSPNSAQFPNAGRMDYSISSDEGYTWSTPQVFYDGPADDHDGSITQLKNGQLIVSQSQSLGFSGHCPYLHRTPNDIILLAYRNTSNNTTGLRYSLDECQTWSSAVVVDTVGGAYPSMVDLKDGTELITYYEEGTGSNIRAKRFRATATGIEWLPVESVHAPEPGTITLSLTGAVGLLAYAWRRHGRTM